MQKTLGMLMAIMLITWACTNNQKNTSSHDINPTNNTKKMNSYLAIFEIPATDISRAINFYGAILDLKVEKIDLPGMEMGLLPYKDQMVTGVIIKGEGYTPSSSGVTIYLNGGHNLQIILDKVEKNGGKIVTPKTPHADGNGYFALFLDSEGNRIGLHSPH
ncbi:MAG TPA: glyoxalase [Microscillaceae bacterium]|nr:glyoxalase [Microscillaceae bacterium]